MRLIAVPSGLLPGAPLIVTLGGVLMFAATATLTTATSAGVTRYAWFGGVHGVDEPLPPAIGERANGLRSVRLPLVTIGLERSSRKIVPPQP